MCYGYEHASAYKEPPHASMIYINKYINFVTIRFMKMPSYVLINYYRKMLTYASVAHRSFSYI